MAAARMDRLSLRFSLSVAALVLVCQAGSFLAVYRYSRDRLLEGSRQQAALATRLVHQALADGMLKKDDHLLREMVAGFAGQRGIERVMILNREGVVRFSSDAEIRERHFDRASPTCQVCHQQPADLRARSAMLEVDGGRTLRVVDPVRNEASCHRCHAPSRRINGLVIVDMDLDPALAALQAAIGHLALVSTAAGMLLLVGTGLVFRRMLVRRLRRFERTARAIAEGDLSQRLRTAGDDALARVERQFNGMADALARVLGRLRQQQAELERVMNSVDDGMVVLDQDRTVVAANEAFARRFSDGADIVGRQCRCEGPGAVAEQTDGACPSLACFRSGEVQTAIKRRLLPEGRVRHEEVRASPVFTQDGRVSHVVEVWRDITERRSAEARLADTERLVSLGMLASGFSHEVNTPLASIRMCLDGIGRLCDGREPLAGPQCEQVAEYARTGVAQVERAGAITDQFLRLSRGQSLPSTAVDLRACLATVVGLCRHKARAAGVALEVAGPDCEITVRANESALQQVMLNLLLNAIDASDRGGQVALSCAREGGRPLVRITDRGRGIAAADLPRIFEPFFSRRRGGTGLGLFVSLNFARAWGGDIQVESRPGEGSIFTVTFPTTPEEVVSHGADARADR